MGAVNSSNSQPPPAVNAFPQQGADFSNSESADGSQQRPVRRRNNFQHRGEPQSQQGPSPYTTLRNDEAWNQRPSAPSLPNLRPLSQDTLLTYAAEMTGWQTAAGGPSQFPQHYHEAMELSRVISQLAMANQQLAVAHNAALAHLEALYIELRAERDSKRRATSFANADQLDEKDPLQKRLTSDETEYKEDDETAERRRMDARITRIENLLTEGSSSIKQRCLCREDDRRLCLRAGKVESLLGAQGGCSVEDKDEGDFARADVTCERTLDRIDVPDKKQTVAMDENATAEDVSRVHLETIEVERDYVQSVNSEIAMLSAEVETFKAEQVKDQNVNEALRSNLVDQKLLFDKLKEDYEASKMRCDCLERHLDERKQQNDRLTNEIDVAKMEIKKLLQEIDAVRTERDTAAYAKISTLEQELQKSHLQQEQTKTAESQNVLKLQTQLAEEISRRQKVENALEDASKEIQRLKETVKTEAEDEEEIISREDIGPVEDLDGAQNGPSPERVANMEEFKKELTLKREARQRAIAAVSSEMERLRRELDAEKEAHSDTSRMLDLLRDAQVSSQDQSSSDTVVDGNSKKSRTKEQKLDENKVALKRLEAQRLTSILKVSDELKNDIRYQVEKVDDLRYQLETDSEHHRCRIRCLTDVTTKTREAFRIRDRRTNELKDHLAQVLVRLGDRSFLADKDDVALECDRQLENINSLKHLYNERLKVLTELKDSAFKELVDVRERLEHSLKKSETLEEDLKKAEEKIDTQDTEISNLESQLGLTKADCRDLQNQMSVINGLFTQMLLGASSADMDLDRLTQLLQENHDLICDMAREEGTEAAALPKLLLDLVEQVEGAKGAHKPKNEESDATNNESERKEDDLQQEDIAHNLPKVWRVLLELLSCHAASNSSVASCSDPNSCYKSVDTPAGPRLVISVSKTYIRLKELILEKKHLEKEMNRMKQLNAHLESKLGEQEKRLSTVSAELTKTWNIVGRMQAQHQQLHTHEKILRYELQQKRKMLQELKQELEYCREKWESARQKNTNTELEWRSLRREFAARKALAVHDSFNNSAESGFSDERGDDTDEDDDVEGIIRLGPRRRTRKDNARSPSSDTESEQPTDTELSESKTGSSATLEQRTPTPETEAELEEIEVTDETVPDTEPVPDSLQEALDPLDQALTNVIQNLIRIDSSESESPTTSQDCSVLHSDFSSPADNISDVSVNKKATEKTSVDGCTSSTMEDFEVFETELIQETLDDEKAEEFKADDGERQDVRMEEPLTESTSPTPITAINTSSTMSIFSIGPCLSPTKTSSIKSVQFSNPLVVGPTNPIFGEEASTSSTFTVAQKECRIFEEKQAKSETALDSDSLSVDSSSSLETVKEFSTTSICSSSNLSSQNTDEPKESLEPAVCSVKPKEAKPVRTQEEVLAARADQLKRLEEQADWLMKKMNATSRRGSALSTRLEELHKVYGEPPVPPPMPDVLPSRRLKTNIPDRPRQSASQSDKAEENSEKTMDKSDESSSNGASR